MSRAEYRRVLETNGFEHVNMSDIDCVSGFADFTRQSGSTLLWSVGHVLRMTVALAAIDMCLVTARRVGHREVRVT